MKISIKYEYWGGCADYRTTRGDRNKIKKKITSIFQKNAIMSTLYAKRKDNDAEEVLGITVKEKIDGKRLLRI